MAFPDPAKRFSTVHDRHHDVEDDEIGFLLIEPLECLGTVRCHAHIKPAA